MPFFLEAAESAAYALNGPVKQKKALPGGNFPRDNRSWIDAPASAECPLNGGSASDAPSSFHPMPKKIPGGLGDSVPRVFCILNRNPETPFCAEPAHE
jgi:hypothetical protein